MSGKTPKDPSEKALMALPEQLRFHDRLAVAMTEAWRRDQALGLLVAECQDPPGGWPRAPAWCDSLGIRHWILTGGDIESQAREIIEITKQPAGLAHLAGKGLLPEDLEARAERALLAGKASGALLTQEAARAPTREVPPIAFEALELHYQAQVDGKATSKVTGVEALIRLRKPVAGWISPGVLQDWIDDESQSQALGEWVLREALRAARDWAADGIAVPTVAVNLSLAQLRHPRAIRRLLRIIEDSGLPSDRVELELTERLPPEPLKLLQARLGPLRDAGVSLALDDFGSGFASLTMLHGLTLDRVKLAARLIEFCDQSKADADDLARFVAYAQSRGLTVVAEGVERQTQRDVLERMGCDHFQGYLVGMPVATTTMAARLAAPGAL